MLGEQSVAQSGDHPPNALVAMGFDHDVAFGVETHRPVVEIGRAHARELVVHHEHLAVHVEEIRPHEPRHVRIEQAVTSGAVDTAQALVQMCAQQSHRVLFEPAFLRQA